ncbi:MAG: hypothetical protein AAB874_06415, partial [Patescibacteria group bacterium]
KAESTNKFAPTKIETTNKYLVLMGGGKDSLLVQKILQEQQKSTLCLWVNPLPGKSIRPPVSDQPLIQVHRQIDPLLFQLNQENYLNGHVPYSAYLAFLSLLAATITGSKYVVVGNEKSADEANVLYLGQKINHQYSKSYEFEKYFRGYAVRNISPDISYFSFLRPLYELQITKLFSKYTQYFTTFSSCNRYKSSGIWCGKCPKCLSIFLLLSPFTGISKMSKIFGFNLLDETTLLPLFKTMIDEKEVKPFECVATYEETNVAAYLILKKIQSMDNLPVLINYFKTNILPNSTDWEKRSHELLTQWDDRHFLPDDLAKYLKN